MAMRPIHATCVAVGERGILILGGSGSGKSDLAIRLIDRGARLVADDSVWLQARAGRLFAAPPPTIAGRIELRGVGILTLPHVPEVELSLAVELVAPAQVVRLPDPAFWWHDDVSLPLVRLPAFEASLPIKVEWALSHSAPALARRMASHG